MALNKRERILAVAVGAVILILGVPFVVSVLSAPSGGGEADRDRLTTEITKKKLIVERGHKAAARLVEWEKRSLPADHELGRSLYQNWLSQLVDKVGLRRSRVESGEGRLHQNAYYLFPFTVRGQGTGEKLVEFLFAFYRTGHLHQIRHLSVKPVESGRQLDLVMTIEAMSLAGAKSDKLSAEPGDRLAKPTLGEYVSTIVRREVFSPYRPASSSNHAGGKLDPGKYAYLTAVLWVGGRPQAWIVARTNDQTYKVSEGDEFNVGPVRSKVVRIGQRDVDLEIDGSRYTVALGTSLRDGRPAANGGSERSSNGRP